MNKFSQLIRFGKHTFDQKTRAINYIANLIIEEKIEYEVIVKPYKKSKTLEQLGYYFAVVVPTVSAWQGLVKDDADLFLREKCAKPRYLEILGETFVIKASIAKMKVDEMSQYIDDCINFLGSHGEAVPPPRYKEML